MSNPVPRDQSYHVGLASDVMVTTAHLSPQSISILVIIVISAHLRFYKQEVAVT
jgi:hypothetical protein